MKLRTNVVLLASLTSAAAWGQEVSVYSTTMAQMWKQEVPGFTKSTYTPATEFLGIDATDLGTNGLSLHLFGWGRTDLADASTATGKKSSGDLSSAFLRYRFDRANAEIKAGRFTVTQGGGVEQVDGVSARADLVGGFAVSAFGGRPVLYNPLDAVASKDYEYQKDFIFGTRLSYRMHKVGEVGVSFLQDGTKAGPDLKVPSQVDYSRKQMGVDIRLIPVASVDFTGRTLFDLASRPETASGVKPSNIAEHDYKLSVKVADTLSVSGTFTERNFYAFFAGTTLPSLFRQDEKDKFRAFGGNITWGAPDSLQVVGDVRRTHRETYGDATRFGGDIRWTPAGTKFQTGFAAHRVNASDAIQVDPAHPSYSLSHNEGRAWVMYLNGKYSASVDGILQNFSDKNNPSLNGRTSLYQLVGSLGIQATKSLRVSGDLSIADTALAKSEVRGLLRAELRFGTASKGGR